MNPTTEYSAESPHDLLEAASPGVSSATADPHNPLITSPEELAEALAGAFLANADAGADGANDHLVAALLTWKWRDVAEAARRTQRRG